MKTLQQKVTEFHLRHRFPVGISVKANRRLSWVMMWFVCKITFLVSKMAIVYWKISKTNKESFYRVHLVLEETAEMMEAINNGNEIKAADGLGDLLYVVVGVATCYWLPAHEIVMEVCKSNETKKLRTKNNVRMRDKGSDWIPPDFKKAINLGRKRLNAELANTIKRDANICLSVLKRSANRCR